MNEIINVYRHCTNQKSIQNGQQGLEHDQAVVATQPHYTASGYSGQVKQGAQGTEASIGVGNLAHFMHKTTLFN